MILQGQLVDPDIVVGVLDQAEIEVRKIVDEKVNEFMITGGTKCVTDFYLQRIEQVLIGMDINFIVQTIGRFNYILNNEVVVDE